jgi:N-acetylmuramic acid 6-phosphate etherase
VQLLAHVDRETAVTTLKTAGMSLPLALVMLMADTDKRDAAQRLRKAKGNVRKAIKG